MDRLKIHYLQGCDESCRHLPIQSTNHIMDYHLRPVALHQNNPMNQSQFGIHYGIRPNEKYIFYFCSFVWSISLCQKIYRVLARPSEVLRTSDGRAEPDGNYKIFLHKYIDHFMIIFKTLQSVFVKLIVILSRIIKHSLTVGTFAFSSPWVSDFISKISFVTKFVHKYKSVCKTIQTWIWSKSC